MAILKNLLIDGASKIGAPIIKKVLQNQLGDVKSDTLAGKFVEEIASKVGVEPEELETVEPETLETAIKDTERQAPEIIDLWKKGLDAQFDLLKSDEKFGGFNVFWRAGWMYLLGAFWIWRIVLVPTINAYGIPLEGIDIAVLATLTGWFMALYMGGHTLKEIGKNVSNSLKKRRGDQ